MTYTDEQKADYVARALDLMCDGNNPLSLAAAANEIGVVYRTLCDWMLSDAHAADYARARCIRAHWHADKIADIARDVLSGVTPPDAARVSIDAHKWTSGRMDSARWGDKQTTEITGKDGGAVQIESTMTASDATAAYLAALKQS